MFFTRLPEEKIHVVEYGLLGWLIGWSLFEPAFSINRIGFAILLGWTIGLCDEIIQYFLPNRVYDIRDVTLNGLSTTLGLFFIGLSRLGQNSLNKVKSYESDE